LSAQNFFLANNHFTTSFYNTSKNDLVIDLFYQNKYFINEWNNKGVSVAYNKNKSSIYTKFNQQGNSKFSDNTLGFLYSHQLSPKLRMSIGNTTLTTQQQEFKTVVKPLLPFLNINLKPSARIQLLISAQTSTNGLFPDKIDVIITRKFNHKLNILLGVSITTNIPLKVETGIVYNILNQLDLELNINTSRAPVHFGIKYKYKQNFIIITNQLHELLGQSIGVQFQFGIL
jgi:hypothetical protein